MKNRRIVIIAMDQPLDSDSHFRASMANGVRRAIRQSTRFKEFDLAALQETVHQNRSRIPLFMEDRYMGILDLLNYVRNGRKFPEITSENASDHYLFANGFTLNGIYLYQYLLERGYETEVVQNYSLIDLEAVLEEKPMAVCISSTFLYLDHIREIASAVKEVDPTIPIIVGGILVKKILDAGATITDQTKKWLSGFSKSIDAFVIEAGGEQTLIKLLESIENNVDFSKVPNLGIFDEKGNICFTEREPEFIEMDNTAIRWDEIPGRYLRNTISVVTSRGCYNRCRFCTYHQLFPKVNYKSVEVLKEELRSIQRLGFVKHIRFADDNITAKRGRFEAVLEMMIEENFEFTWSCNARANSVNPEILRLMKDAGCDMLGMGIESGSRTVLKNMDKRLDPQQAFEAIRLLREFDIDSQAAFIVGYPGETRETFQETIDFINKSELNYYIPYLFSYSQNMLVGKEREKYGIQGLGTAWKHNTMDSAEASYLSYEMIRLVENGYTDGQQSTWDTYKILRGEDYTRKEILDIFRLNRELKLLMDNGTKGDVDKGGQEEIFKDLEAIIT